MKDLDRDPIINVIHRQIKDSIRITLENDCWAASVILIYSGIDAMAYLNMPENQDDVIRNDFVNWVERYISFPCREKLTGLDLYGARCGMLHQFGTASRLNREGKCRQVGYLPKCKPEVIYNPEVSTDLVMLSIKGLADAFFNGIDRFLVDLFANSDKAKVAEKRFPNLVHVLKKQKNNKNPVHAFVHNSHLPTF